MTTSDVHGPLSSHDDVPAKRCRPSWQGSTKLLSGYTRSFRIATTPATRRTPTPRTALAAWMQKKKKKKTKTVKGVVGFGVCAWAHLTMKRYAFPAPVVCLSSGFCQAVFTKLVPLRPSTNFAIAKQLSSVCSLPSAGRCSRGSRGVTQRAYALPPSPPPLGLPCLPISRQHYLLALALLPNDPPSRPAHLKPLSSVLKDA